MGLGGISIWQLAIIAVIVVLIFGTKKLKNIGSDLGGALKGFKNAMDEDADKGVDKDESSSQISEAATGDTIDVKAEKVEENNK